MNWRKSNRELAAFIERGFPFLYAREWQERIDRCIAHLQAIEDQDLGTPGEVRMLYTDSLRMSAEWLVAVADRLDKTAAARAKITSLRNTTGRTPQEAAEFQRKADELEAKR